MQNQEFLNQFNFPVEIRDVFVPSSESDSFSNMIDMENKKSFLEKGYKAIVRMDTDELITINKPTYKLVRNEDVITSTFEEIEKLNLEMKINENYSYVNNERMKLQVDFPEITINDGESDLDLSFFIHNSYDMSEGVRGIFGFIRLVCANGMVVGKKFKKFYHKHTKSFDMKGLESTVKVVLDQIPEVEKRINELKSRPVNEELVKSIKNMTKAAKKDSGIMDEEGKDVVPNISQWELYNRLTYFVSHVIAVQYQHRYQQAISKYFSL